LRGWGEGEGWLGGNEGEVINFSGTSRRIESRKRKESAELEII